MPLVVVEREHRRVAPGLGEMEDRIRPHRPRDGDPARASLGDRGLYLAALLVAEEAVLAAVRIEAGDDEIPVEAEAPEGGMAASDVVDKASFSDELAGLAQRDVPRE